MAGIRSVDAEGAEERQERSQRENKKKSREKSATIVASVRIR
jgi:hypothetical protein